MTSYDENGFLGGRILDWVVQQRESHKTVFGPAQQLNRESHAFIDGRAIDASDAYKLTSLVLFIRLLELYQGVLLAVDRGMRAPTRIAFRAFLEAFFHFAAIHKDPAYLNDYLDQFDYHKKALINRIRQTTDQALEHLRKPITAELVQAIERIDVSRISTEQVARRAGWHNAYVTAYAMLSGAVHSTVADLDTHLEFDNTAKRIVGLRYGPTEDETLRTVCLLGITMVEALRLISTDFAEDRRELCDRLKISFETSLPEPLENG